MTTTTAAEAPPPLPFLGNLYLIPPENEAKAVLDRTAQWESSLRPWDLVECNLSQQIARETIRLERLHQREIVARHQQALLAGAPWEAARRDAAESLAAGLSRHPAKVLAELRRSKSGCEAIARRWETLLATLDARGSWTPTLHANALDLLGVAKEWREAITPLDAPAGTDPVAHLRDVAAAEARRHRDLAAALTPVDTLQREALRVGLGPDTPELDGIRKEERAADRRLAWCRSQFKTGRREPRPPDSDNRPPYPFKLSDQPYQSDEVDTDDLPPVRKTDMTAPQPMATPPKPDPSDPRRPSRGSPTAKSRRRRA